LIDKPEEWPKLARNSALVFANEIEDEDDEDGGLGWDCVPASFPLMLELELEALDDELPPLALLSGSSFAALLGLGLAGSMLVNN